MPRFQDTAATAERSRDWAIENRPTFIGQAGAAVMDAVQKHHAEKAARAETAAPEPTAPATPHTAPATPHTAPATPHTAPVD